MRLLRPYVPIPVRIKVALRQLDQFGASEALMTRDRFESQEVFLDRLLAGLSLYLENLFGVLHLDHDPALTNRKKIFRDGKHVGYSPAANNPKFLIYRTEAGHDIKTRVHGDGAQHSDLALRRKNKNIARNRDPNQRKFRWPKRRMGTSNAI